MKSEKSRRFTKKRILERLDFWKSELAKLEESTTTSAPKNKEVKQIMLEELLDRMEIFDLTGSWSDYSGPSVAFAKFSPESLQKLKEAFAEFKNWRRGIGLARVMSREEYVEETQDWDDPAPYEDYLEDEIYRLEASFGRNQLSDIFKPTKILVLGNTELNHDTGKTVLAALYAIL